MAVTLTEKLLNIIFVNRAVERNSLNTLCRSNGQLQRCLTSLLKHKYVSEHSLQVKEDGKGSRSFKVYTITSEGMDHILEKNYPELFDIICKDQIACKNFTRREHAAKRKVKLALESRVVLFCHAIGATVPQNCYTPRIKYTEYGEERGQDPQDQPSQRVARPSPLEENDELLSAVFPPNIIAELSDMQYESLQLNETAFQYDIDPNKNNFLLFTRSDIVKDAIVYNVKHIDSKEVRYARFTGVLDGQLRSIFLYHAPLFDLDWSETHLAQDKICAVQWGKSKPSYVPKQPITENTYGAILVKTVHEFKSLYKRRYISSQYGKRKKDNKMKDPFGAFYTSFFVIPTTKDGAILISLLAIYNDAQISAELIDVLCSEECGYRINETATARAYPLVHSDGTDTALGHLMDAQKLNNAVRTASNNPRGSYRLLCFDWQAPYYEAVLPENVTVVRLEEMGIKMDILPSVEIPTWLALPDDESEGMRRPRPFGGLRNRSNDDYEDDYEDDYDDFDEF